MSLVYPLKQGIQVAHSEVGGKGHSLLRMLDAQLAVPGGFVLGVSFFSPWLEQLRSQPEWQHFLEASAEELETVCNSLKTTSHGFSLTSKQQDALNVALSDYADEQQFAVRSSSPEEDLEGSSFAGAYETVLGVTQTTMETAIKTAFASCLDVRIAVYKKERGFPINDPKIAVVVQLQMASEVAGVGFSINPLNNHYDEAVFNANWGLGETVVAGIASPDLFVVEKNTRTIQERRIGGKETSIWLLPEGGTEERQDSRSDQLSLTDEQVLALTEQLVRIEDFYGKPMDIEWAFAKEELYLLQARPITTHLPLAPDMITQPGEPKRLYFDVTIAVQGILEPLSPLGIDIFSLVKNTARAEVFGIRKQRSIDEILPFARNGRIYMNVCNMIRLRGKETVAKLLTNMDSLASQAVAELDWSQFHKGKISKPRVLFGALSRIFPRLIRFWRASRNPTKTKQLWDQRWKEVQHEAQQLQESSLPFDQFSKKLLDLVITFVARDTIVMFPSAKIALSKIHKLFKDSNDPEVERYLSYLDHSIDGNVTVEMGHALYDLHASLPSEAAQNLESLKTAIQERSLPDKFLKHWDEFLATYGQRGVKEIDVATPRYREQPDLLLQQLMGFVQQTDQSQSPVALFEAGRLQRLEATQYLSQSLESSPKLQKRFLRWNKVVEVLGGQRETHKFVTVFGFDQIRTRALKEGQTLLSAGRIDELSDVFYLSFNTLVQGLKDSNLDLRPHVQTGKQQYAQANQCKQIFPIFDSRGCFHRPAPPEAKPGEIVGQGVSTGKVQGRIKVLNQPDEKPLYKGEILVARATDPGWTPLFANAAGIILEIGGPLQHGALVAREYGIPCVSGILNATQQFQDGELVEVDGFSGIIRKEELLTNEDA